MVGLDTVELVMAVEEEFGLVIPDDEAAQLTTVGRLHAWLVDALRRQKGADIDEIKVFNQLREIICDVLAVSPDQVLPEARFVQDLHAD